MSEAIVNLVGNLGRDPELRYTPQGRAVCDFSVATNGRVKGKDGEWYDKTLWYKITCWEKQAENCAKYLAKGRQIYVVGELGVEDWTDRDGVARYTLVVQAIRIQFIGGTPEGQKDYVEQFSGEQTYAPTGDNLSPAEKAQLDKW